MAIVSKVGLEAEFLLFNAKDTLIVPPATFDRDAFPLLGEIRGEEAETWPEVVSNFMAKQMDVISKLRKGHTVKSLNVLKVPLKTYKEANRQINPADKDNSLDQIKNIYGTDISTYSDQVIKAGKIQGINVSCGLHIHFSCSEVTEWKYEKDQYDPVTLPIGLPGLGIEAGDLADLDLAAGDVNAVRKIIKPTIMLYRKLEGKVEKEIEVRASRLNKPAIEYIVKALDGAFFKKFAPAEKDRTKYRQPGFFEIKPYGFEYRSLPANENTLAVLPELAKKAFDLLKEVNEY